MDLQSLQKLFQANLLADDPGICSLVADNLPALIRGGVSYQRLSRQERLDIYRYAYTARLIEALADTYPAVKFAMGDAAFDEFARQFVANHPSSFPSIRDYGAELSYALREWQPTPAEPDSSASTGLAELAAWEWALAAAFDSAEATAIDGSMLSRLPPERWPTLRFQCLPSLRHHTFGSNALAWWRAAVEGGMRPDGWRSGPAAHWVIWRNSPKTSFRSMPPVEASALSAILSGDTFEGICAAAADIVGADSAPLKAATLLKSWLAAGWIVEANAD
ncbi:MAG: DNA-binding domain-containing protein [Gammaproteobacteria bacterium]